MGERRLARLKCGDGHELERVDRAAGAPGGLGVFECHGGFARLEGLDRGRERGRCGLRVRGRGGRAQVEGRVNGPRGRRPDERERRGERE